MCLGVPGKKIVRPCLFSVRLRRCRLGCLCTLCTLNSAPSRHGVGGRSRSRAPPILRRLSNPPDVSGIVKRYPDQKMLLVFSQRQAVRHSRRCASAAGQPAQHHGSFNRQRLRRLQPRALRAYQQRHALRHKRMPAVQAGHGKRNFHAQSSAAPRRFGCEYFHLQSGGSIPPLFSPLPLV